MKKILLGCLLLAAMSISAATDYYVRKDVGAAENNGTSWATPLGSIHQAVTKAQEGDRIHFDASIYPAGGAYLTKGVSFYGGYKVTGTGANITVTRNLKPGGKAWEYEYETVFEANATKPLRLLDYGGTAIASPILIEGITFSKGLATDDGSPSMQYQHGGALRFRSFTQAAATITIRKCQFKENKATKTPSGNVVNGYGGAIASDSKNTTIEDCYFFANEANEGSAGGGAIYMKISYTADADISSIKGCTFDSNRSNKNGGAVRLDGDASYVVRNNIFFNNEAHTNQWPEGGALFLVGTTTTPSYAEVENCLFYNNVGSTTVSATGGTFRNITCANGARFILSHKDAKVYNSLFFAIADQSNVVSFWNTQATLQYCASAQDMSSFVNVSNAVTIHGYNLNTNGANLKRPTTFMGLATTEAQRQELLNADWSISSLSPLKKAGSLELAPTCGTDLAGYARPTSGTTCSIGAYEYDPSSSIAAPSEYQGFVGVENGRLIVEGENATVTVYTVGGVRAAQLSASGSHSIALNKGIYAVRIVGENGTSSLTVAIP